MGLFSPLHLLYWEFEGPLILGCFASAIIFFFDNFFPIIFFVLAEIPIIWVLNWCYFYWDHIKFVDNLRKNQCLLSGRFSYLEHDVSFHLFSCPLSFVKNWLFLSYLTLLIILSVAIFILFLCHFEMKSSSVMFAS